MPINNALAGVAVANLDKAVAWYTSVIGHAPDTRPMPELAEFQFANGGWMQLFADSKRAGQSSVTLTVSSLDAQLAVLKKAGVTIGTTTHSDYVDTASVDDPDGNRVVFAQAKSSANKAAS